MSSTIKIKRSNTSGNAPDTNNIVEGELALNTADGILYSRGGNDIFEVGANLTTPFTVNPSTAADTITLGSTTQEGTITLGRSTSTNLINIGNAQTASGATQTINIGGNSASGGDTVLNLAANSNTAADTAVTIGCSNGTGTHSVAIRGASTFTNGAVAFDGNNFSVNPAGTTNTITMGKTTGTGLITIGRSTANQDISIGSATGGSGASQTTSIGCNMGSGGTKTVNIGSLGSSAGARYINIGTNASTNGLSATTTIGSLHTAAVSNNYLYGITRIKKTNGQPLIVESTSSTTNTTLQGIQLYNTTSASAFKIGNYLSLAQVQSYYGSGSGASIQFLYGQSGEKHRLDASGKFGIGVSSPLEALHVNGNIIATGNVTAYYSDERLKDFKGAIPDALDKVNKLTGYYYKPNALAHSLGVDNTELEVGVSAQEVEEVLPEIVTKSAVGQDEFGEDYKSVSYDKLTPLLIEAVKELTQKVAYLESKISEKGE
jgi:hypothetical protein